MKKYRIEACLLWLPLSRPQRYVIDGWRVEEKKWYGWYPVKIFDNHTDAIAYINKHLEK